MYGKYDDYYSKLYLDDKKPTSIVRLMSDFEDGFDLSGVFMINYKNHGIVYAFVLSAYKSYKAYLSSSIVTGPSLQRDTFMSAPNMPVST